MEIETIKLSIQEQVLPVNKDGRRLSGLKDTLGGVYLTWEDLWVTVSKGKHKGSLSILQGLTGYVQPGEVLAIMGPSGCGKSTLLDALAGRLDSSTRQSGDILINSSKQSLSFGTSAYVTQDDILMKTLTVKEAVYYSAILQLPDSVSKAEKKERAETTIKEMGLQDAMNTRIGGSGIKVISGGQKRRVSICIEILTRPKLLFLDEPTSGLDSAASYHVMNRIVTLAKRDGRTVIASIHQPSSEVFELFHNLCLLSSGKTIYFGLASRANEDIEHGFDGEQITTDEAIESLVNSYKSSEVYELVRRRVTEICKKESRVMEKGNQTSFVNQSLVLTRRSFINMYRDLGYYWLRLAIYIALGTCVGTVFPNLGHSFGSIQDRAAMLMYVAGFLTFMAIAGFPSFAEDMKNWDSMRLHDTFTMVIKVWKYISTIPPVRDAVVNIFGQFMDIRLGNSDNRLIQALTERWWPTTHTFMFPCAKIEVTPLDFTMLTSLSIGRYPTQVPYDDAWCILFNARQFLPNIDSSHIKSENVNISHWRTYLTIAADREDNITIARTFILFMMGHLWFQTANDTVPLGYLAAVADLDKAAQYDWDSAILASLYHGLIIAVITGGAIIGFSQLLEYWFLRVLRGWAGITPLVVTSASVHSFSQDFSLPGEPEGLDPRWHMEWIGRHEMFPIHRLRDPPPMSSSYGAEELWHLTYGMRRLALAESARDAQKI
ncbi:hypothetical protein GIB67_011930 [Kingdonia uniflora]|uniref:ABC transporter domain-containing protein n=1 Tax=Kingdonia uniflora TaxID=39325 RepID=A0A7J7LZW1_9MAGN|nr:hypothetical protein GIB67_011930 [Kingdonia uniflora]